MSTIDDNTRERARTSRLRRKAEAKGYMLVKSRTRDRLADDYGLYVLVGDGIGNRVNGYGGQAARSAFARGEGQTLNAIEQELALL
jgi:hypothetical protein